MTELAEALGPVRSALLTRARADAAATLDRADSDAAAVLAQAETAAQALLHDARAAGERDAAVVRAREVARERREARMTVLRAQTAAFAELRRRALAEMHRLRADPAYPALRDRLRAQASEELGPDATVSEHPDGGVVATAPGRRLDLTLATLAGRAVDDLGPRVTALWT